MDNQFQLTGAWRPEFRALDYFTQGFVEALFFTAPTDDGTDDENNGRNGL